MGSLILGVLRDILFARNFGASGITDVYFSAFLIADILLVLCIGSALLGLVTPIFMRERDKKAAQGYKIFGSFFTVLQSFFLLVIIISLIYTPELFSWIYPEYMNTYPKELVFIGRVALLSNFFFALSNFLGTFLMAHKSFYSTALAPLFYNLGILLGIYFFADTLGIHAAAYGALVGALAHFLSRGFEYIFQPKKFPIACDIKNPCIKELVQSMFIRWPTVVIFPSLTFVFCTRFASETQEGLYSLFFYARNIEFAPISIFAMAISVSVFPIFSQLFAEKNYTQLAATFWNAFAKTLFWMIPFTIGIFFLGSDFLWIVYEIGGEEHFFNDVSILIFFLSGALIFESLMNLFARVFNAMEDTKTPLFATLIFALTMVSSTLAFFINTKNPALSLGIGYMCAFIAQFLFYGWKLFQVEYFSLPKTIFAYHNFSTSPLFISIVASFIMGIGLIFSQIMFSKIHIHMQFVLSFLCSGFLFFVTLFYFWRRKTLSKIKSML